MISPRSSRKAGVTEFIILGMIVLIVVFFLLYLRTSLREQEVNPSSSLLASKLRAKSFEIYIQSCLDTALKESLDQLGEAGGYAVLAPHKSLGGLSILLFKNPAVLSVPDYPCDQTGCQLFYNPALGCTGSLNYCQFSLDPPFAQSALLPIIGLRSWTTQLETLIQEKVRVCSSLDQEHLVNSIPTIVSQGTPRVRITHETQGITAELELPFTLSLEDGHEQSTVRYQSTAPLRLRLIHSFIEELLYRDSSDPGFAIDRDFSKLTSYFPGFNVSVDRATYAPRYDLVLVSDTFPSAIRFSFLRENLPPSLNYVFYAADGGADIVLSEGAELILPLYAYDPDEDLVRFSLASNPFAQLNGSQLRIRGSSPGTDAVKLIVSDGELEDYQMLRIRVT